MVGTVPVMDHGIHAGLRDFVARFVDLFRSGCALHGYGLKERYEHFSLLNRKIRAKPVGLGKLKSLIARTAGQLSLIHQKYGNPIAHRIRSLAAGAPQ